MIEPVSSLDAKVHFLLQPESYPEPTLKVEAVETHMSCVFLTDQFAYKLKKPVKTSFLDYSTVELRRHFCEEEIRLNKRLAPTVYLSTVAITRRDGEMVVGGDGPAIDWLVKMRRLPRDRMLDQAIRNRPTCRSAKYVLSERASGPAERLRVSAASRNCDRRESRGTKKSRGRSRARTR